MAKAIKRKERSCGNCANCEKYTTEDGKECWTCEEYGFYYVGMPVSVHPPYDKACDLWTDDPKRANTWEELV